MLSVELALGYLILAGIDGYLSWSEEFDLADLRRFLVFVHECEPEVSGIDVWQIEVIFLPSLPFEVEVEADALSRPVLL